MKIVFLGDSVTQGCFDIVKNKDDEWELIIQPEYSYVTLLDNRLKKAFPDRDITVINAGVSGDGTEQALGRLQSDVLAYNPDITVVCLGLNNSGRRNIPEYVSQLSEIFERISNAGSKIVFLTPNMLNTYVDPETPDYLMNMAADCADIQNNGEMDKLMAAGIEAAKKYNAVLCDVYSLWKKLQSYGIDTTKLLCNHINHPTRKMHGLFADSLYEILKEMI